MVKWTCIDMNVFTFRRAIRVGAAAPSKRRCGHTNNERRRPRKIARRTSASTIGHIAKIGHIADRLVASRQARSLSLSRPAHPCTAMNPR
jgi:hypothetical protein